MASKINKINVAELDFDNIKTTLTEYLRQQEEFTDYDFTGSGLSVLIDLLAYNTHYNAYYTNMIANEMFLDSAADRNNVVSRARQLGYTMNEHCFSNLVNGSKTDKLNKKFTTEISEH